MLTPAVFWIAVTYLFSSAVALVADARQRASKWSLHALLWVNFLGACGVFLVIERFQPFFVSHNPLGQNRVELFTIIVLAALLSLVVELPGFLLNSRYDRATVSAIDGVADALLDLRVNPSRGTEPLEGLLSTHDDELKDLGLASTLQKMAGFFKQMDNVDIPLLEAVLSEIRRTRERVEARSKHPLPTLVQFLGLSGLAFVLGEILAVLRGSK
jgi:hypothetical protein